jgi:hypothetical protein
MPSRKAKLTWPDAPPKNISMGYDDNYRRWRPNSCAWNMPGNV